MLVHLTPEEEGLCGRIGTLGACQGTGDKPGPYSLTLLLMEAVGCQWDMRAGAIAALKRREEICEEAKYLAM